MKLGYLAAFVAMPTLLGGCVSHQENYLSKFKRACFDGSGSLEPVDARSNKWNCILPNGFRRSTED